MSTETTKEGAIVFVCDFVSCREPRLDTGTDNIRGSIAKAKEAGWLARKRGDVWKHYCCAVHESAAWRVGG